MSDEIIVALINNITFVVIVVICAVFLYKAQKEGF